MPEFSKHIEAVVLSTENENVFLSLRKLLEENDIRPVETFSPLDFTPANPQSSGGRAGKVVFYTGLVSFILLIALQFYVFYQSSLDLAGLITIRLLTFVPVSFVISLLISAIVLLIWFWTRSWLVPGTIPENFLTDNHFDLILEARDFEKLNGLLKTDNSLSVRTLTMVRPKKHLPVPLNLNKI